MTIPTGRKIDKTYISRIDFITPISIRTVWGQDQGSYGNTCSAGCPTTNDLVGSGIFDGVVVLGIGGRGKEEEEKRKRKRGRGKEEEEKRKRKRGRGKAINYSAKD